MRRTGIVLIALVLLTSAAALHAAPTTPADLRAVWSSDTRLMATLSWTQSSDADRVCVEKHDTQGAYTLIGCGPGYQGETFTVALPPHSPHDIALVPHVGDTYTLIEFFGSAQTSYDPATLGPRVVLLPLVAQP